MKTQFIKISILLLLSIIFISCSSSETKEDDSENLLPTTAYDISSILSKFDGIDAVSYTGVLLILYMNLITVQTLIGIKIRMLSENKILRLR